MTDALQSWPLAAVLIALITAGLIIYLRNTSGT